MVKGRVEVASTSFSTHRARAHARVMGFAVNLQGANGPDYKPT